MIGLVIYLIGILQILPQARIKPDPPKYYSAKVDSDSIIVHFGFINEVDQSKAGGATTINVRAYKNGEVRKREWPWKLNGSSFDNELFLRILPSTYYVINKYVCDGVLGPANWGANVIVYPVAPETNKNDVSSIHYTKAIRYSSELAVISDADSIVVNCVFNTTVSKNRAGGIESVMAYYFEAGEIVRTCNWPCLSEYKSLNEEIVLKFIPSAFYTVRKNMDDRITPESPMCSVSFTILPVLMNGSDEDSPDSLIRHKQKEIIKQIEEVYRYLEDDDSTPTSSL